MHLNTFIVFAVSVFNLHLMSVNIEEKYRFIVELRIWWSTIQQKLDHNVLSDSVILLTSRAKRLSQKSMPP